MEYFEGNLEYHKYYNDKQLWKDSLLTAILWLVCCPSWEYKAKWNADDESGLITSKFECYQSYLLMEHRTKQ